MYIYIYMYSEHSIGTCLLVHLVSPCGVLKYVNVGVVLKYRVTSLFSFSGVGLSRALCIALTQSDQLSCLGSTVVGYLPP